MAVLQPVVTPSCTNPSLGLFAWTSVRENHILRGVTSWVPPYSRVALYETPPTHLCEWKPRTSYLTKVLLFNLYAGHACKERIWHEWDLPHFIFAYFFSPHSELLKVSVCVLLRNCVFLWTPHQRNTTKQWLQRGSTPRPVWQFYDVIRNLGSFGLHGEICILMFLMTARIPATGST